MLGGGSIAENYHPASLLSVVSKVIEKLVNNRIIDDLKKCGLFSDFQYSFRSSQSTADLLTVVSDRIARAFNRFGATSAVTPEAFDKVWYPGLLHKRKCYKIQVRYLALFLLLSVIDSFEWFWMGRPHKNILLMLKFLKAPFLGLLFSCYVLFIFLIMLSVILESMLIILLSTLTGIRHLICSNN